MLRVCPSRWGLWAVVVLMLVSTEGQSARRSNKSKTPKSAKEAESRTKRRSDKTRPPPIVEVGCRDDSTPRCESALVVLLQEDGSTKVLSRPFRYRMRFGEQLFEGACPPDPRAKSESSGRCVQGGISVRASGAEAEVFIDATGMRPILQILTPTYESQSNGCGGTCQRAEVRLSLRPATPTQNEE